MVNNKSRFYSKLNRPLADQTTSRVPAFNLACSLFLQKSVWGKAQGFWIMPHNASILFDGDAVVKEGQCHDEYIFNPR